MRGIDTNILVRYVTRDDEAQAVAADRLLHGALSVENPGYLSSIVLCELAWVLGRAYQVKRDRLALLIKKLLNMPQIQVEAEQMTWQALADFRTSKADFADCLMGRLNQQAGCDTTHTFDAKAGQLATFTSLLPGTSATGP